MSGESILGALIPDEQALLARDPFFTGGLTVLKQPQPNYQTNAQAILGPLLQGLAGGAMMGYGKEQVRDVLRPQYSKLIESISGSPYDATNENWTPEIGKSALTEALMGAQQKAAQQEANNALMEKLLPYSQLAVDAAGAKAKAESTAKQQADLPRDRKSTRLNSSH